MCRKAGLWAIVTILSTGCGPKEAPPETGSEAITLDQYRLPWATVEEGEWGPVVSLPPLPYLTPAQQEQLETTGLALTEEFWPHFAPLYLQNAFADPPLPPFITTDAVCFAVHAVVEETRRVWEEERLRPALKDLSLAIYERCRQIYECTGGTPLHETARRQAVYFGVACRLLELLPFLPPPIEEGVEKELAALRRLDRDLPSEFLSATDRQRFAALEKRAPDPVQRQWLQAVEWYRTPLYELVVEAATKEAAAQVQPLAQFLFALDTAFLGRERALTEWTRLARTFAFFQGQAPEELDPLLLQRAYRTAFGPSLSSEVILDREAQQTFWKAVKKGHPLGRRLVLLGNSHRSSTSRQEAGSRGQDGNFAFSAAAAQLEECLRTGLSDLRVNVPHLWLAAIAALRPPAGPHLPPALTSSVWERKTRQTRLAVWVLTQQPILPTERPAALTQLPPPRWPGVSAGIIEPCPGLYGQLERLTTKVLQVVQQEPVELPAVEEKLAYLQRTLQLLRRAAHRQARGLPPAASLAEERQLYAFGAVLEALTCTYRQPDSGEEWFEGVSTVGDSASAVIAVPTEPPVYAAVGGVQPIYLAVPREGTWTVVRGGVFTYYELPQEVWPDLTPIRWQAVWHFVPGMPLQP
ncbi:MAG TPA: DUF3160 domain-containing protein [Armatimonadetes bacterium]|nr:DUF3160 domain-containing protein [Armatimonadota bacterium]